MNKEVMYSGQIQFLIFSFGIGAYLLFNMGSSVGQDAWIASSLSTIIGIPIVLLYGYIGSAYPGKNIYDIIEVLFGRIFGTIINLMIIIYGFILGTYIIGDFVDFIKITSLFNTPTFATMGCIGILSIWILRSGVEVLAAWSHFFIRNIVIFMAIFWILLIPQMEPLKLTPVFYNDFTSIIKESIKLVTFPVTEVFIFLTFFNYVEFKNKSIFIKPIIISGIISTSAVLINLMLLGPEAYKSFYYPGYESIKRLQLGGEFQRIEIMIAIAFTVVQFLEFNYCILGALKGIEKVCRLKSYREMLVPTVLLFINLTYIMFQSHMEAIEFTQNLWPIYGFITQIIFPIIIFTIIFIKKRLFLKKT